MQDVIIDKSLVSVVIVTYNSSRFVLETLESVKEQTYKNLELIITDDCSNDDTVEICSSWLVNNADRFVRTELITSDKNTGIAANINRGFSAANAKWIKPCAGDDVLVFDAVEKLVNFMLLHNDVSLIHGRIFLINASSQIIGSSKRKTNKLLYPTFDEQMRGNAVKAPTGFYNKADLFEVGGFNSKYAVEDYYICLKLLDSGKRIFYIDEVIAKYRIHDTNFSHDRISLVKSIMETHDEFRNSRNFFKNHYIFCRNILINNFNTINRNSFALTIYVIKLNPYALFSFFDIYFWYPVLKRHFKTKVLKIFGTNSLNKLRAKR